MRLNPGKAKCETSTEKTHDENKKKVLDQSKNDRFSSQRILQSVENPLGLPFEFWTW